MGRPPHAELLMALVTAELHQEEEQARTILQEIYTVATKEELAHLVKQLAGFTAMATIMAGRLQDGKPIFPSDDDGVGAPTPAGTRFLQTLSLVVLEPVDPE